MNPLKNYINHSKDIITRPVRLIEEFHNLLSTPAADKINYMKQMEVEMMYDMLTPVQKMYVRPTEYDWEAKLLSSLPKDIKEEVYRDLDIGYKDDGRPILWEDRGLARKVSNYLLDDEDKERINKFEAVKHKSELYLSAFMHGHNMAYNYYEFLPNHSPIIRIEEAIQRVGANFDEDVSLACGGSREHEGILKWLGLPGEELAYQRKACIEGFIYAYEGVIYCHYTKQRFADMIYV